MAEQQDREVWVPEDIIRQNFHTRRGPLVREEDTSTSFYISLGLVAHAVLIGNPFLPSAKGHNILPPCRVLLSLGVALIRGSMLSLGLASMKALLGGRWYDGDPVKRDRALGRARSQVLCEWEGSSQPLWWFSSMAANSLTFLPSRGRVQSLLLERGPTLVMASNRYNLVEVTLRDFQG